MRPYRLPAALLRAAILAGVAVGLVDGIRAAALGHAAAGAFLACVTLTVGFDVLVAAAAGASLALLLALGAWGKGRRHGWLATLLGWLLAGAIPAGIAIAAVTGTAARNNRFLAAGVVALASLVAAVG